MKQQKAFTFLVKLLRSGMDSLLRQWRSQARNPRIPSFASAHSSGFTLAETLITLTILGVVAAITVPSLINKYIESSNRTKVKKAMAAYEKALNQIIIEKLRTIMIIKE